MKNNIPAPDADSGKFNADEESRALTLKLVAAFNAAVKQHDSSYANVEQVVLTWVPEAFKTLRELAVKLDQPTDDRAFAAAVLGVVATVLNDQSRALKADPFDLLRSIFGDEVFDKAVAEMEREEKSAKTNANG